VFIRAKADSVCVHVDLHIRVANVLILQLYYVLNKTLLNIAGRRPGVGRLPHSTTHS
jgi:hypothetical protein